MHIKDKITAENSHESGICTLFRNACAICEKIVFNEIEIERLPYWEDELFPSTLLNRLLCDEEASYIEYPMEFTENSYVQSTIKCLDRAERMLEDTFLDPDEVALLRENIHNVRDERQELIENRVAGNPFPTYWEIICYLNVYYELLKVIFSLRESIKDTGLWKRGFLEEILNLDCVEEAGELYVNLYAPAFLEALRNIYDSIWNYCRIVKQTENSSLRSYYREIFVSKILRTFRWYLIRNGKIYHAAIPPYCGERHEFQQWRLGIPVRRIEKYNSFEGIGELRLLDKIIYELDRRQKNGLENWQTLSVSIIGDINLEPICQLKTVLEEMRDFDVSHKQDGIQTPYKKYEDMEVSFKIYSLNTEYINNRESDKGFVTYQFKKYSGELKNPKLLETVIENSDVVFILDSCDMYTDFVVKPLADIEMFWQRIVSSNYDSNYKKIRGDRNLSRKGNLTDLLNVMTAYAWKGETGVLSKDANDKILAYIERTCELCNRKNQDGMKSVYVYVSDVKAFRSLYRNTHRFVRVERYNEKEIGIIRYSGYEETPLAIHHEEKNIKTVVFNLWQVVKHVSVRHRKELIPFLQGEAWILCLREILVGVDYSNWPSQLRFMYYIPKWIEGEYQEAVEKYLEEIVLPFFKKRESDMYYEYFIKSIGSFLYSDAKCLDDMLFLHVFLNQHDLLKNTVLVHGNREELTRLKREGGKYSQKRFYSDIMRDYDTSSELFAAKYTKLEWIEKDGNLNRRDIFRDVMEVCEQNQYKDSYLYHNCHKML